MAKGWVPAAPIVRSFVAAVSSTWRRRERSCPAAWAVFEHGLVEISSTDSISSGLISPAGAPSSIVSIALTSSSDPASRIISSSSIPIVYGWPVNWCCMRRSLTAVVPVDWAARFIDGNEEVGNGSGIRRKALRPRVRPPGLISEEDVRNRGRSLARGDRDDFFGQAADLRGHAEGGRAGPGRIRRRGPGG